MDQERCGPEPDDSRSFGLHRPSWARLNGSLSVADSGAFPYSARQIESTEGKEKMAGESGSNEILDGTVKSTGDAYCPSPFTKTTPRSWRAMATMPGLTSRIRLMYVGLSIG